MLEPIKIFLKEILDNPEAKRRFEICQSCDQFNQQLVQCRHCGCFLKGKTIFPGAKCPVGKW